MKIEKLNRNQIRCTLTREDLESRNIKLSELVYGTRKAKKLFNELMKMAAYQCDFDTENMPLMVEAIPVSSEEIVLIVSKVQYPDELDARFSSFSDDADDNDDFYSEDNQQPAGIPMGEQGDGADEIIKIFKDKEKLPFNEETTDLLKIYEFDSLDDVCLAAKSITDDYEGENTLYKSPEGKFQLLVYMDDTKPEIFNRICNILAEYGSPIPLAVGTDGFIREHYKLMIDGDTFETLKKL